MKETTTKSKAYILPIREDNLIEIEDFQRKYFLIDFYLRGLNRIRVIYYDTCYCEYCRPYLDTSKEKTIDHTLRKYGAVQLRKLKGIENRFDTPPHPDLEYPSYLILEF